MQSSRHGPPPPEPTSRALHRDSTTDRTINSLFIIHCEVMRGIYTCYMLCSI